MSDIQLINIPLRSHVKRFAEWHLRKTPELASKKSVVGLMVYAVLSPVSPDWKPNHAESEIELNVHRRRAANQSRGLVVTTKKAKLLEDMLDSMFMKELMAFIAINKLKHGWNKRKAMRIFLENYNITEQEMPLQTLIKRVYRAETTLKPTPAVQ